MRRPRIGTSGTDRGEQVPAERGVGSRHSDAQLATAALLLSAAVVDARKDQRRLGDDIRLRDCAYEVEYESVAGKGIGRRAVHAIGGLPYSASNCRTERGERPEWPKRGGIVVAVVVQVVTVVQSRGQTEGVRWS